MKQLSIPGTRKFQPRLPGDEAMRQHMRAMRKAMKEKAMEDKLQELERHLLSEIAEHDKAIETRRQMAQGLQSQLADCAADVMRREGAKVQANAALNKLREMMGPQAVPVASTTQAESPPAPDVG